MNCGWFALTIIISYISLVSWYCNHDLSPVEPQEPISHQYHHHHHHNIWSYLILSDVWWWLFVISDPLDVWWIFGIFVHFWSKNQEFPRLSLRCRNSNCAAMPWNNASSSWDAQVPKMVSQWTNSPRAQKWCPISMTFPPENGDLTWSSWSTPNLKTER